MCDSFGARAEDLCAVREAGAQRMRRSMDADGDGTVSASEVLAFVRNVAAAEAAGAVQAVRVRGDRLQGVPASVLRGKPPFVAAAIYNTASMYKLLLASSMATGDAARQLLSLGAWRLACSVGLVLLDLTAAAAFSQLFLAAALLGGGTLVSWASGLAVTPASSGLARGLQPWLQHVLQPTLQRLSPRVAAAAALSGGAVTDATVLGLRGLRGLLSPLAFAAFAVDTLVRNALRRRGVRGRAGFAIRQCMHTKGVDRHTVPARLSACACVNRYHLAPRSSPHPPPSTPHPPRRTATIIAPLVLLLAALAAADRLLLLLLLPSTAAPAAAALRGAGARAFAAAELVWHRKEGEA